MFSKTPATQTAGPAASGARAAPTRGGLALAGSALFLVAAAAGLLAARGNP
jgi:hypothetical protein